MVCLDKFDTESSQVDGLSVTDHLSFHASGQIVFLQLVVDQTDGKLGAIHRRIQLFEDIGKCSDMILVTMGDHKPFYLIHIVFR